jgi:hypothetical protein
LGGLAFFGGELTSAECNDDAKERETRVASREERTHHGVLPAAGGGVMVVAGAALSIAAAIESGTTGAVGAGTVYTG